MRNFFLVILSPIIFLGCMSVENKPLKKETEEILNSVKNEYNLSHIDYGYSEETKNGKRSHSFHIHLGNFQEKEIDFNNVNKQLFEAFNLSNYEFKKCKYIIIGYYSDIDSMNRIKTYYLNGHGEIVEIYDSNLRRIFPKS